jgi:hypothetical protein
MSENKPEYKRRVIVERESVVTGREMRDGESMGELFFDIDYSKDTGDNPFTEEAFKENMAIMIDLISENERDQEEDTDRDKAAIDLMFGIFKTRELIEKYFKEVNGETEE